MVDMPDVNDPPPNGEITSQVIAARGLAEAIMIQAKLRRDEEGLIITQEWCDEAFRSMLIQMYKTIFPPKTGRELPEVEVTYTPGEDEFLAITPINDTAKLLFDVVGGAPHVLGGNDESI